MSIFCPLFSGSSGNSEYIGYGESGVLIDAGVSAKRLTDAMCSNSFDPHALLGIFITHEHSDHISGLRVFAKKYGVPVFCSEPTMNALLKDDKLAAEVSIIPFSSKVELGGFTVERFPTSHDCEGSSGYVVHTPDNKRIAVCTDLGYVSDDVSNAIDGCNLVMLESNHDVSMLRNGSYPYVLKQRIASDKGHLSNACCATELVKLIQSGTTRFVLGHLSKENNRPSLALDSAISFLKLSGYEYNKDYTIEVASPCDGKTVIV